MFKFLKNAFSFRDPIKDLRDAVKAAKDHGHQSRKPPPPPESFIKDEKYPSYRKTPRLYKDIIISEKIDGTNAVIRIQKYKPENVRMYDVILERCPLTTDGGKFILTAGGRDGWLTLVNDNHGFCQWVHDNASDLVKLGEGVFYGEFYGNTINRGYDLKEKRLSFFLGQKIKELPYCCTIVPILYSGIYSDQAIETIIDQLKTMGSVAVPGYKNPEGIIVFHTESKQRYKITFGKRGDKVE